MLKVCCENVAAAAAGNKLRQRAAEATVLPMKDGSDFTKVPFSYLHVYVNEDDECSRSVGCENIAAAAAGTSCGGELQR